MGQQYVAGQYAYSAEIWQVISPIRPLQRTAGPSNLILAPEKSSAYSQLLLEFPVTDRIVESIRINKWKPAGPDHMNEKTTEDSLALRRDAVLLGRIQAGDQGALAELYDQRQRLIYSLALSIVSSPADAEEVTQEVFFRVWEKAGIFDESRGSALSWMVTMTRRLAIDRTRSKHYKAGARSAEFTDKTALISSGDEAFRALEHSEALTALETLSADHREVINLSFFEGLSHSQIADCLDKPLGTVKSRIREAIGKLRQQLQ